MSELDLNEHLDKISEMLSDNFLARLGVLGEVGGERRRQDERWGEQNHPDATPESFSDLGYIEDSLEVVRQFNDRAVSSGQLAWDTVLLEEVYEALAEAVAGRPDALRTELIQVAAVAAAWVEAIDRRTEKGNTL